MGSEDRTGITMKMRRLAVCDHDGDDEWGGGGLNTAVCCPSGSEMSHGVHSLTALSLWEVYKPCIGRIYVQDFRRVKEYFLMIDF